MSDTDPTAPTGQSVPVIAGSDISSMLPATGHERPDRSYILRLGCCFAIDDSVVWLYLTRRNSADGQRYHLYRHTPGYSFASTPCTPLGVTQDGEAMFELLHGGLLLVNRAPDVPMRVTGGSFGSEALIPGLSVFGKEELFDAVATHLAAYSDDALRSSFDEIIRQMNANGPAIYAVDPGLVDVDMERMSLGVVEHTRAVSRQLLSEALYAVKRFYNYGWPADQLDIADRLLLRLLDEDASEADDHCDVPAWCFAVLRQLLAIGRTAYETRHEQGVVAGMRRHDPLYLLTARLRRLLADPEE